YMRIVVIDGQGGGFGRSLIEKLRAFGCKEEIIAVGTNAMATNSMLKAGANAGATGENAVIVNAGNADILAGPIGLVIANSMLGECSPAMALAVANSHAYKVLIPSSKCCINIAGLPELTLAEYIQDAASRIIQYI
ncbi:hypothetical protein EVA_20519, partial [gut metagenome]